MQTTKLAVSRGSAHAGSGARRLGAAVVAASLAALAGCATGTLDTSRRHVVTAGLGSAMLDGGPSDLHGAWALHGAYDRRLTELDGWLAVSARMVAHAVVGSSVTGDGLARPCDLSWTSVGPSLGLQVPVDFPVSFVGDAGAALAHVSRRGCSASGESGVTTAVPQLGFGVLIGMSPQAAWKLGGRYVRLPLDEVGVGAERRWASSGELGVVIAF